MKKPVILAVSAGFLLLTILIAVRVIAANGGLSLGAHVGIAMWLGIILSFVLGIGLMSAVFLSSRRGVDGSRKGRRKD